MCAAEWKLAGDEYGVLVATGRKDLMSKLVLCESMISELERVAERAGLVDHYAVLALSPTCSSEDITVAFRELGNILHPCTLPTSMRYKAQHAYARVVSAHQALSVNREGYDERRSKLKVLLPGIGLEQSFRLLVKYFGY
mmetsp:Transcript_50451/g.96378  ORF Transcript_50451/g.96378 Transcript_50451/m.96378 type:complete len:140 (+) Transcript_50451:1067-1486(+)